MTPREILERAEGMTLVDEDGDRCQLAFLPPLDAGELTALEGWAPCPLPADVRDLLTFTRGFDGILESLDFSGVTDFGFEEIFPYGLPIAHDGYGNYWLVDLLPSSTAWSPIYYVAHDPPVVVFQTDSLAHFVTEVLRFGNPPHESEIDEVHESLASRIWRESPDLRPAADCRIEDDSVLADFADGLDEEYLICDLRGAKLGDGFAWGRFGPKTIVRRDSSNHLFAIKPPPGGRGLLGRFFGGR